MKKLFLFAAIITCFVGFGISANAIEELPEDGIAYVFTCDTCKRRTAYDTLPQATSRKCYYTDCDGTVDYTNYTYCAKEYYYAFDCGNAECNITSEYEELPEGTADAPYGVCRCGTARTEDMFWVSHHYKQYSRPCFYCYQVQIGTNSVYDSDFCPDCGETYYDVYEYPDSVDENGNLIYGGGGDYLYYCSETNKFYEAEEPEDDEEVNADCPYCDIHEPLKINVIYSTECPDCGTRAEYERLVFFEKPFPLSTLNNIFEMMALNISNGSINPADFDLSIYCLECGHSFADDNNIIINRHVDAPKDAVYEEHANDLPYSKTDKYAEEGSEYDNFFEKILWRGNYLFNTIKEYVGGWIQLLIYGQVQNMDTNTKNEVNTYSLAVLDNIQSEILEF